MEPISVPINHSKEEEAMKPITDKRKQCSDSSSDDDSEGDEEEKKNEAKWLRTHRAKRSSQKECYDPQLEVYKNTLLKEIESSDKHLSIKECPSVNMEPISVPINHSKDEEEAMKPITAQVGRRPIRKDRNQIAAPPRGREEGGGRKEAFSRVVIL
ncbi:unnamed protein product [Nezara viridula]|uniref:Uncharacterized protein n=1 Tax=Nezara viridula TaxID=85310 RepID=A0A9P0HQB8_NEZVI|nr:unnamed protein product [Nezara viridula]